MGLVDCQHPNYLSNKICEKKNDFLEAYMLLYFTLKLHVFLHILNRSVRAKLG